MPGGGDELAGDVGAALTGSTARATRAASRADTKGRTTSCTRSTARRRGLAWLAQDAGGELAGAASADVAEFSGVIDELGSAGFFWAFARGLRGEQGKGGEQGRVHATAAQRTAPAFWLAPAPGPAYPSEVPPSRLLAEALALPPDERGELAAALLRSLAPRGSWQADGMVADARAVEDAIPLTRAELVARMSAAFDNAPLDTSGEPWPDGLGERIRALEAGDTSIPHDAVAAEFARDE